MEFNGRTLNIIDPSKPKSIFDPNSAFMRELEIYKLKSETKPRKTNMIQAQIGMMQDFCSEDKKKTLYVPVNGSYK